MLEPELQSAVELARAAGSRIMEIFRDGFEVIEKSENTNYSEPVTAADIESSRIIVDGLFSRFPQDAVLSEEEEDDVERRVSSERVWIVDPLDGTKGFTEKKGDFAVQIGLIDKGSPVLGVVYQPINQRLYFATSGNGAFVQDGNESAPVHLKVSSQTEFSSMTLAVSRSHRSRVMTRLVEHFGFADELPHGSVGLKVGFLAQSEADIYVHLSPHTKFWDTAAPQIILEEAGGKMTDIFGDRIRYELEDVRNLNGIFSTNGVSHTQAIEHLRPLLTDLGRLKVTKK